MPKYAGKYQRERPPKWDVAAEMAEKRIYPLLKQNEGFAFTKKDLVRMLKRYNEDIVGRALTRLLDSGKIQTYRGYYYV